MVEESLYSAPRLSTPLSAALERPPASPRFSYTPQVRREASPGAELEPRNPEPEPELEPEPNTNAAGAPSILLLASPARLPSPSPPHLAMGRPPAPLAAGLRHLCCDGTAQRSDAAPSARRRRLAALAKQEARRAFHAARQPTLKWVVFVRL